MNLITMIIIGGLAGWLASIVVRTNKNQGKILNIIVGVLGAIIGGWIFRYFGDVGVTGFSWHSLWVSTVGAVVLLIFIRIITRRR
jgi:uncharacterized membrane protein YeaQ/YmgE (transglycosylase-associated protein family)